MLRLFFLETVMLRLQMNQLRQTNPIQAQARAKGLFGPAFSAAGPSALGAIPKRASFLFLYFFKKNTEIYFWFYILQFYTPTARQGAAGGLPSGREAVGIYM